MHATIRRSFAAAVVTALVVTGTAGAQGGAARLVDFEDASLPAKQKELLSRYADTVARWALVQRVVQAVAEQNARPLSQERILEIDRAWQAGGNPDGLPRELASNDCAQALQSLLVAHPGYSEVFVSDARGALVCMTARTSDYWQGDEAKFTRAWAGGRGAQFVSAIGHDESAGGLETVHVSVPVVSGGRAIGVLTASRITATGN
jgi:hypothetical protein